jgi:CBS domain-containing protein
MITGADLLDADDLDSDAIIAFDLVARPPVVVQPWESCRTAAERMAEAGVGRLSVVADDGSGELIGIVTPTDLLVARRRRLEEEREREPPMFLRKG